MLKRSYIYLDLGFYGPCNLRCAYCRSDFVRDDGRRQLDTLMRQIDLFAQHYRAAVAKMSGYGEITMWSGFSAFLPYLAERMPCVQVISNGTFNSATADLLLTIPNASPNLTIDGHTLQMNYLRVYDAAKLHDRILSNLRILVEGGRRVEINCVLHDHNSAHIRLFCNYLAERYDGRVMLFPYPARSFALAPGVGTHVARNLAFLADQLQAIADDFQGILPPRIYMEELRDFLIRGRRHEPCYVHWTNLGSGSRNERLYCANYGEDLSYGPMDIMLADPEGTVAQKEKEHFIAGFVGLNCTECFNHYHIIGPYLDGRITIDDIQRLPSLASPAVRDILIETRTAYTALAYGQNTAASQLG